MNARTVNEKKKLFTMAHKKVTNTISVFNGKCANQLNFDLIRKFSLNTRYRVNAFFSLYFIQSDFITCNAE